MSRISDTRFRTREAAARLRATGRRTDELTVDLIYAEIRQGSRTTINDELKLWKDEQAKVDALSEALPPAVANAMMAAWAVAVEHGEKVFEARRQESESELSVALEREQEAERSSSALRNQNIELAEELNRRTTKLESLRHELLAEREARVAGETRIASSELQLQTIQAENEKEIASIRSEYENQSEKLESRLSSQEQLYRTHLEQITRGFEAAQSQMVHQIAEMRDNQKEVESRLAAANQKNEDFLRSLRDIEVKFAQESQLKQIALKDLDTITAEIAKLRSERDSLIQQLASVAGRLEAQVGHTEYLERRVALAEARLRVARKQPKTFRKQDRKPPPKPVSS
jgi:chromosome segregation ATPase